MEEIVPESGEALARLRKTSVVFETEGWERLGGERRFHQRITGITLLPPPRRVADEMVKGWWGRTPDLAYPPDTLAAEVGVVRIGGPAWWAEGPVAGQDEMRALRDLPLRRLKLEFTDLTDAMLDVLPHVDGLMDLNVGQMSIGDEAAMFIGRCRSLETLALNDTRITDRGVAELGQLERLRHLFLGGTATTGQGLARLRGIERLETLHVHGTNLDDVGAQNLAVFPLLGTLSVGSTRISDKSVPVISRLEYLRELDLGGTNITSEGVAELAKCRRLMSLRLDSTQIDDKCLATFAEMPALRFVDARKTRVTVEEAKRFHSRNDRIQFRHDDFEGNARDGNIERVFSPGSGGLRR